jgi:hypothetical protein
MYKLLLSLLAILSTASLFGQLPATVTDINAVPNQVTAVTGNISSGAKMETLRWASTSSNACFPGTQDKKFTGNHTLHKFDIPPYSEVTITLIPDDKNANFSLYGYQVGTTNFSTPPALASCVSCEADHKWDYPKRGETQDHTRSVFFNSIKNPYNIFIGVAGADGLDKGGYTLKIDLKSRVENTAVQAPLKVMALKPENGVALNYVGNLNKGAKVHDLSWASSSSNACFPATQNKKFRGNHTLHSFEIPPYSEVVVTVIPDDKRVNFSLYGYQVGTNNSSTPPNLASCVSCEADHKWDYPKRDQTQDHTRSISFNSIKNPYKIYIGVAGADGLTEGAYTLRVDLKSRVENTTSQAPLKIYTVKIEKGKTVEYDGDLDAGCKLQDLSFAENSSVACFPATQNHKFSGNQVFYVTEIPKYSKMWITVVPDDKSANMSIYAYQDGTSSQTFPPQLSSCVSCEAEHKWDYPRRGKTQDHTRTVYLNAINNPYRVVIAVAGADGLATGKYTLQIKTE